MNLVQKIIHNVRYSFDEAYRIERGVGLSPIRSKREREAVIAFCRRQLEDHELMRLNPERKRIYKFTVMLYEQEELNDLALRTEMHHFKMKVGTAYKFDRYYNDVDEFILDFAGWYWD